MTKYLFICHSNIARSQIGEAFARMRGLEAMSAGINVTHNGKSISNYPEIVKCMTEVGYLKLGEHRKKQLTQGMIEHADKLIVLVDANFWPEMLQNAADKIEYHDVEDPAYSSYPTLCAVRDQIRKIVNNLD